MRLRNETEHGRLCWRHGSTPIEADNPGFNDTQFYSFELANCVVDAPHSSSWPPVLFLSWITGELNGRISTDSFSEPLSEVSLIECNKPILAMWFDNYGKQPFISSYQSPKLWQPFFEVECTVPGQLTPALTYPPTKPPSSGAHSLTSWTTSWLALFGVSILSLGLGI